MTVYEARSREDLRKIADFIVNQKPSSLPMTCWQRGMKGEGLTFEGLEYWATKLYFHLFYVEDDKRGIRCVLSVHERMTIEKVPIATHASVIMKDEDWESNNGAYFKELLDHIIRNEAPKYKLERGDFFGVEKYANWTKELCGNSMTIAREHLTDLGIVYRYEIDFAKYVERQ